MPLNIGGLWQIWGNFPLRSTDCTWRCLGNAFICKTQMTVSSTESEMVSVMDRTYHIILKCSISTKNQVFEQTMLFPDIL